MVPGGQVATPEGDTGRTASAAQQEDAYARCGLRLTYHPDRDTVVPTVPVPPATDVLAAEPTVRQAEFAVG